MVAEKLGMAGQADTIEPVIAVNRKMKPSPALSQYVHAPQTIVGRKIGLLVTDGTDAKLIDALIKKAKVEKAIVEIVAPKAGGFKTSDNKSMAPDHFLAGAPSALFDAVVLAPSSQGCEELVKMAAAVDWLRMAFAHLKIIGYTAEAAPLFAAANVDQEADEGVVSIQGAKVGDFIEAAKKTPNLGTRSKSPLIQVAQREYQRILSRICAVHTRRRALTV